MQISMHNWMRAEPIEDTIARLARCGYDAIEISGEPERYDTKHVRKLLAGSQADVLGVGHPDARRPRPAGQGRGAARGVGEVRPRLHHDGQGAGRRQEITIVPSTVGKIKPQGRPEEEWQWAVDSLKSCYEHGQREGVRLAIEPLNRFETYFLNRHDQALALAKEVGPDCGVCIDVFHMNIEEKDMYQAIRNCKGRLADFHVADNNRMACGMGHCDWGKIIGTLKEIGYDGALTVEFVAPVDRTPANPYPNAIEKGPVNLTADELKFIEDHGSSTLSDEFYTWLVSETSKTLRKYM